MKKILIVEDETTLLKMLTSQLTADEFTVITALNGKQGLEKALNEKPDLMLLDLLMPVMDGLTMLKSLRENPRIKDTPVIVLTNFMTKEYISEAKKLGCKDYILKSDFNPNDISRLVKMALKMDDETA